MSLLCPVDTAVQEHELVDYQPSILSTKKPDCQWLVLGYFPDGLPHVALVNVDLPALWEVEVLWSGVAVVADELYFTIRLGAASLIFATVADVLASNVP